VLGQQSQDLLDRRMLCLERRRHELESVVEILGTADRRVVDNAGAVVAQLGDLAECSDTAALLAGVAISAEQRTEAESIRAQINRAKVLRTAARDPEVADLVMTLEPRVQALAYDPITTEWTYMRASVEADQGNSANAIARLYEAARVAAASNTTWIEPVIWLALVRLVGTQVDRPLELPPLVKAAEIAVARAGDKPTDRAALALAVGMQELNRGELVVAETRLRDAAAILTELRGADHPETLEARELLALTLHGQREYDEAETILIAVADGIERTLGATHPRMGTVVANLGRVQAARGDLEGARKTYMRAIVALEAGGPRAPSRRDRSCEPRDDAAQARSLRRGRSGDRSRSRDRAQAVR